MLSSCSLCASVGLWENPLVGKHNLRHGDRHPELAGAPWDCDETLGSLVPRLLDTQVPLDAEEELRMELGAAGWIFPRPREKGRTQAGPVVGVCDLSLVDCRLGINGGHTWEHREAFHWRFV